MSIMILGNYRYNVGSFINTVDIYNDLKRFGFKPEFKAYVLRKNHKDVITLRENHRDENLFKSLTTDTKFEADIGIINFSFVKRILQENKKIELNFKRLIVVDECDQWISSKDGTLSKCLNFLESSSKEIIFLCCPATIEFCGKHKSFEYYHKMDPLRLERLKTSKINGKALVRHRQLWDGGNKTLLYNYREMTNWFEKTNHLYIFECERLLYSRYNEAFPGIYWELMGMITFEFLWLGKEVFYSSFNKSLDDGVTHYLKLFGINDNYSQHLNISTEDVEDKLFMKSDDKLLELIS